MAEFHPFSSPAWRPVHRSVAAESRARAWRIHVPAVSCRFFEELASCLANQAKK